MVLKLIVRISLLMVIGFLLVLAFLNIFSSRITNVSRTASAIPTINSHISDVPGTAIPTLRGGNWIIASDSDKRLFQCLTREKINFNQVRTLNYSNAISDAYASISWIQGAVAPPDYFTTAIQLCVAGVKQVNLLTGLLPGDFEGTATVATRNGMHSYATATNVDGIVLLAFWMQPGAELMTRSPASAMVARAVALYKANQMGVKNPEVMTCPWVSQLPKANVPAAVNQLIQTRFSKSAPVNILNESTVAVDLRAESVIPHICLYVDGRQVAYAGRVPTSAVQALLVDVMHSPDSVTGAVENFVEVAMLPNKKWVILSLGGL